jgi:hypothetical protein
MSIKVKFAGETMDTGIVWTGGVWRRPDNGQQHASYRVLVRGWLESFVSNGGDDVAECEAAIESAVETAGED